MTAPRLRRRQVLGGLAITLAGCRAQHQHWHNVDVSGAYPALTFTMTDADGGIASEATFRGKVVLLYFGYTDCPDVCPLTLGNIAKVLDRLGPLASRVAVLFVTVDPNRDSLDTLRSYTAQFAPEIVGLRGTPDQLAALARPYRVAYSVTPATATHPYEVTHSSVVYAFDASGATRLLIPSLASGSPDIAGTTADLRQLITGPERLSWWARLRRWV